MSAGTATRSRGTIIKVPDVTPGLLIVNGQQLAFTLEGRWKSPVAPAPNMSVEVDVDDSGAIAAVSVVDAQQIARERLEQFGGVAQQQGKVAAEMARQGVGALAARMGTAPMVAAIALWVAWFFLPLVVIEFFGTSRSVTFWQVLGLDSQNPFDQTGSHGLSSLLGLLAIGGAFRQTVRQSSAGQLPECAAAGLPRCRGPVGALQDRHRQWKYRRQSGSGQPGSGARLPRKWWLRVHRGRGFSGDSGVPVQEIVGRPLQRLKRRMIRSTSDDRARWDRVQSVFHEVADRPAAEQRGFLEAACTDDPTLIADVLALLDEDAQASLLDRNIASVVRDVVGAMRIDRVERPTPD